MECKYRDCGWGIAFGGNNKYYLFRINREGWYTLELRKDNKWFSPLPWKSTNAFIWDANNKIDVVVDGNKFQFYVNDRLISNYEGEYLTNSEISLAVDMGEGVTAKYYFDDILLKVK